MPTAEVACQNGVTVICLEPVDENIREPHRKQYDAALAVAESIERPLLVMDLKNIHYVNSSFVALLLKISHKISQRHGRFGICRSMPFCEKVIHSLRLNEIFDLFETPEQAILAYTK